MRLKNKVAIITGSASGFGKGISKKFNLPHNTVDFVFHGGSGSSVEEIREAIGYGVIKMNIDTDMQYAFMTGVRDYFNQKSDQIKVISI